MEYIGSLSGEMQNLRNWNWYGFRAGHTTHKNDSLSLSLSSPVAVEINGYVVLVLNGNSIGRRRR